MKKNYITEENKNEFIQLILKQYLSEDTYNSILLHQDNYKAEFLCDLANMLADIKIVEQSIDLPF